MFWPWEFQEPTIKYEGTSLLNFTQLTWFPHILRNTHRLRAGFLFLDDAPTLDLRPWPIYMSLNWRSSQSSCLRAKPLSQQTEKKLPIVVPQLELQRQVGTWTALHGHVRFYPFRPVSRDFAWRHELCGCSVRNSFNLETCRWVRDEDLALAHHPRTKKQALNQCVLQRMRENHVSWVKFKREVPSYFIVGSWNSQGLNISPN